MAFLPNIAEGIARHTDVERAEMVDFLVSNFKEKKREQDFSLMDASLEGVAECMGRDSLLYYFNNKDLPACKKYAFNAAMAHRLRCQLKPAKDGLAKVRDPLFFALLSGHKGLINWYAQYRLPLYIEIREPMPRHENIHRYEYFSLQVLLALSGEWEELKQRSEAYLQSPPSKWPRKQDYRFFIALAEGDVQAMQAAVEELLSPKIARSRIEDVWGLQKEFMHSWVFIYTKIALIHGYELNIDNPWIPKDLLPLDELPEYQSLFDIWDEELIFKPFEDNPKSWCKNARAYSPENK